MTRKEAIKKIKEAMPTMWKDTKEAIQTVIPELFENENERMVKEIKRYIKEQGDKPTGLPNGTVTVSDMIAWLEKQSRCNIDYPQKYQDNRQLNGCIVLEDFNGGEGFYKLNLDYLNKKQVEEVEEMVRMWNKESKTSNENIIKACIGMYLTDANEQRFKDYNTTLKDCLDWLEKQKEQESARYFDKDMIYAIMNKLHKLAFSQLISINSDEYKKIDEITSDVRKLLDYPIEQPHIERSDECCDSLKFLCLYWKPSEEQIADLCRAEGRLRIEGENVLADKLAELWKQLRKFGYDK